MISDRPIFPGSSTMNQLERIISLTGKPTASDVDSIKSPFASTMLDSIPPTKKTTLNEMFPKASKDAIDLMNRCLQFNPDNRCTAQEALAHPFIAEFHNPDDEPDYPNGPITISLDDNQKLTASDYRDKLYREINDRRKRH